MDVGLGYPGSCTVYYTIKNISFKMAVGVCINGTKHGVSLLCLLGCHAVTADSARIIELWGGGNKPEE